MREPFETLLGQYRDHWLLWSFLEDDVPDFAGIAACDMLGALSAGEMIMLHVALAFWNGDRTARVAQIIEGLDDANQARVADALYLFIRAVRSGR